MSFDFSWFKTGPGILITLGLVCLLIGLVFLILSGKKDKGEKSETTTEVKVEDASAPAGDVISASEPTLVVVPQAEENIVQQNVENPDVVIATPEVVNEPVVAPVEVVTPVAPEVVVPAVEVAPVVPVENNEVVETPVEQIAVETPVEAALPVADESVASVTPEVVAVPAVEAIPAQENTVSIYGGVSPQVNLAPTEEPKKVYGGADPLENTGALPRVEVPAEPVVAPVEVTTPEVVVPTVEVPVAPVEEPAAPVVEPVVETSSAAPSGDIETLEF